MTFQNSYSASVASHEMVDHPLHFSSALIRRMAKERLGGKSYLSIFLHQGLTEWRLRLLRHVNFRKDRNEQAVNAYVQMRIEDFEGINFRQHWSNWRTIPKALSGYITHHPVRALDLCSGTGQSTEVLACYLPKGSEILGIEYSPQFVDRARRRSYLHIDGTPASVQFRVQSVLEVFRDQNGHEVPTSSVDLVNSSGAVGFHFNWESKQVLVREIARVLRPRGWASIDSGMPGARRSELARIFLENGFELSHTARSCALDPYRQFCFRRKA